MSDWKPSDSLIAAERIVAQLEEEAAAAGSTITPVFRHRMVSVLSAELYVFSTRVHDEKAGQKVWTQVQPNKVVLSKEEAADALALYPHLSPEQARLQFAKDKAAASNGTHTFAYAQADDSAPTLSMGEAAAEPVGVVHADKSWATDETVVGKKGKRGPKAKGKKAGKRGRTAALAA